MHELCVMKVCYANKLLVIFHSGSNVLPCKWTTTEFISNSGHTGPMNNEYSLEVTLLLACRF
jgi:hypothetical protein